jgi:hypothetical protein
MVLSTNICLDAWMNILVHAAFSVVVLAVAIFTLLSKSTASVNFFFLDYARELCIVALNRKSLRKDTGDAVAGHYIHSLSATF